MNSLVAYLKAHPWVMYVFAILLMLPALLINLGQVPVIFVRDEAIRGLVALEMMISENYIVPTLHGEYYYNKPPLFNWMIILMFKLTGSTSLFSMRLVTVIALIAFGATIYHFLSRHYNRRFALLNALMFITCGRILLWDSFIALIDITFSWVIYLNFMIIYQLHEKRKYLKLFLLSYLLISLAFLMKALPAVAFQGISLLVFFIYRRDFKRLFHWHHFAGIGIFIVLVGGYYLIYSQYNTLEELLPNLLWESGKRTVVRFGIVETLKHIAMFPFEQVYHFAPWSLLIVVMFSKKVWRELFKNPFLKFNFMMFIFNIILYWTSPEVHPRYILMLAPLVFLLFSHFAFHRFEEHRLMVRALEYIFLLVSVIAAIGVWYVPYYHETANLPLVWPKVAVLSVITLLLSWLFLKIPAQRMIIFVSILFVLRIGFDWFAFPPRDHTLRPYQEEAEHVARMAEGKELYLYKGTIPDNPNTFYITRERGKILTITDKKFYDDALYLSEESFLKGETYETLYEYRIYFQKRKLLLVRFTEPETKNQSGG